MVSKPGKRRAQQAARQILARYSFSKPPVPIEKIAQDLGAEIERHRFETGLSGLVFIKDGVPIIGVNAADHKVRRRFTIAHEVGHLLLHRAHIERGVHVDKTYPVLHRDAASATGENLMEIEANTFASELLMPEDMVNEAAAELLGDIDDEEGVKELAKQFAVSTAAMRWRLLSLFS